MLRLVSLARHLYKDSLSHENEQHSQNVSIISSFYCWWRGKQLNWRDVKFIYNSKIIIKTKRGVIESLPGFTGHHTFKENKLWSNNKKKKKEKKKESI